MVPSVLKQGTKNTTRAAEQEILKQIWVRKTNPVLPHAVFYWKVTASRKKSLQQGFARQTLRNSRTINKAGTYPGYDCLVDSARVAVCHERRHGAPRRAHRREALLPWTASPRAAPGGGHGIGGRHHEWGERAAPHRGRRHNHSRGAPTLDQVPSIELERKANAQGVVFFYT